MLRSLLLLQLLLLLNNAFSEVQCSRNLDGMMKPLPFEKNRQEACYACGKDVQVKVDYSNLAPAVENNCQCAFKTIEDICDYYPNGSEVISQQLNFVECREGKFEDIVYNPEKKTLIVTGRVSKYNYDNEGNITERDTSEELKHKLADNPYTKCSSFASYSRRTNSYQKGMLSFLLENLKDSSDQPMIIGIEKESQEKDLLKELLSLKKWHCEEPVLAAIDWASTNPADILSGQAYNFCRDAVRGVSKDCDDRKKKMAPLPVNLVKCLAGDEFSHEIVNKELIVTFPHIQKQKYKLTDNYDRKIYNYLSVMK